MSTQVDVAANVSAVLARLAAACAAAGRNPHDVAVLIASKTQPLAAIETALASFCAERSGDAESHRLLVGESRVQELVSKEPDLSRLLSANSIDLHFIGSLQKNKINQLLGCPVTCVQTIDSLELAQALSHRCERVGRSLEVMVQVNISRETSKAGCLPDDAAGLATAIAALPNLRLTGFMTIGLRPLLTRGLDTPAAQALDRRGINQHQATDSQPTITNADQIRAGYRQLREIRDAVVNSGQPGTDSTIELSMGMSTDLELAIAEGATIVRIGTALFGPREQF